MNFTIGIDEAGRGPLAGPVSIGMFATDNKRALWILKNLFNDRLRDSKKLSEKKREEIYKKLLILKKQNLVYFSVSHASNKIIDKYGISNAINLGINKCLKNLHSFYGRKMSVISIKLDGLLKAPREYTKQETIIKGDEKNIFISCASIVAKVERDRLMTRLSKMYPEYALHKHKGYGTSIHTKTIKKFGLSSIHRSSFCKYYTNPKLKVLNSTNPAEVLRKRKRKQITNKKLKHLKKINFVKS
jgi:ribonuclease HII